MSVLSMDPVADAQLVFAQCDSCGSALDVYRTLTEKDIVAEADSGFHVWLFRASRFSSACLSDELLSELKRCVSVPVERLLQIELRTSGGPRIGWVLLPPVQARYQAVSGVEIRGWRCDQCGAFAVGHGPDGAQDFVRRSDIEASANSIFSLGSDASLWLGVMGEPKTVITSFLGPRDSFHKVGLVDDEQLLPTSNLPLYEAPPEVPWSPEDVEW